MRVTTVFLLDIVLAAFVSVGIVMYIKNHLQLLLIELCGTAERASFWLAFCNVTLVLVPLIFVLSYEPELEPGKSVVLEVAGQLKYAFIGFGGTLGVFAFALLSYVPRDSAKPTTGAAR